MSADAPMLAPAPRRARPSPADRLRKALVALGEGHPLVVTHGEKAWASITFSGARHRFALCFSGEAAVAAGERFLAALPEHEFVVPGQLVADAAVLEVEHRLLPDPQLLVSCELLLLEEA